MPRYRTGNNNLAVALSGLVEALQPSAESALAAQYRRAASTKALSDAAARDAETRILLEREARASELAGPMGELLVQENLGAEPGISEVIAGPPTRSTTAREGFLRALPAALLSREGNTAQFAQGLNSAIGGAGVYAGPGTEDALRRSALLMSGGTAKYDGTDAITSGTQRGLVDAEAAAKRRQALDVEAAKLHNVPEGNVAVRAGTGAPVSYGQGAGPGAAAAGIGAREMEGTGVDQQAFNFVNHYNDLRDAGAPPSPADDRHYQTMLLRLYGPKTEIRKQYNPETRAVEDVVVQVTQPVPPGVYVPPELQPLLSGTAPQAAGTAPQAAGTALPAAAAGGNRLPGSVGVVEPSTQKSLTEAQGRMRQYADRIGFNMSNLMNLLGYDPQTGVLRPNGFRPGMATSLKEGLPRWLRGTFATPQESEFFQSVAGSLNPLIRADSGAAVPDSEYPRYYDQFIPQPGEPDSAVRNKLDNMLVTQLAFDEVASSGQLPPLASDSPDAVKLAWQEAMQRAKARIARESGIALRFVDYGAAGPLPPSGAPEPPPSGAWPKIETPVGTFTRVR